ncbi:WD domain, G-beta repeat [Rubripirellula obstinata]|uniref:WD domain, G-beta repeat n=1 Tax=Rubripirellula obstinata TaxID=406547 RepID=A0A5B1CN15_9BACT|nr:WD40 repeat domain-containing protein [Rubripirellula obstinata]KAA1261752.1 WD domain, G-beta repeat [Rubripirellula obstinata]
MNSNFSRIAYLSVRQVFVWGSIGLLLVTGLLVTGLLVTAQAWAEPPPVKLPSESQLPDSSNQDMRGTTPLESELPQNDRSRPRPATLDLPAEGKLPVDDPLAVQRGADENVDRSTDHPPILRLNHAGHQAMIRALDVSEDGRYCISGGDDKAARVWQKQSEKGGWKHFRTIRWQVGRGNRGRLNCIAMQGDLVAMAGNGAMGGNGEVAIFNYKNGNLVTVLVDNKDGHRQPILNLDWCPSVDARASQLLSQDMDGRVLLWTKDGNTGLWSGEVLVRPDAETLDTNTASLLLPHRRFAAAGFRTSQEVLVPVFDRFEKQDQSKPRAIWKLKRIDLVSKKEQNVADLEFRDCARQIEASRKGNRVAVLDATGQAQVLVFDEKGAFTKRLAVNDARTRIQSLDLWNDGSKLAVGTPIAASVNGANVARQQWWGISDESLTFLAEAYPRFPVGPMQFANEHELLYSAARNDGNIYRNIDSPTAKDPELAKSKVTLDGVAMRASSNQLPEDVAFAPSEDGYKIRIQYPPKKGQESSDLLFDLKTMRLTSPKRASEIGKTASHDWLALEESIDGQNVYRLYDQKEPRGATVLRPEFHGRGTCLLPFSHTDFTAGNDGKTEVSGVLIGTAGRNNVYLFQPSRSGPARLIRQFRDHSAAVRTISVSDDARYLVTSAADGLISIWNCEGVFEKSEIQNRWGVELAVEDRTLVVKSIDPAGPLYFRGVRLGDTIRSLDWTLNDGEAVSESEPSKMLERLKDVPFDIQIVFRTNRQGRPLPDFQSYPAWRPLATLFVDEDREWAFWTPAGYYDASFNGHQRFGWQFNRGVNAKPDFFRAAQFRGRLERPDIMRRLLRSGSLWDAMRSVTQFGGLPPGDRAIVSQTDARPIVKIVSPVPGSGIVQRTLTVVASVDVANGDRVEQIRAFASSVPAISQRSVPPPDSEDGGTWFEFEFKLPTADDLQVHVVAVTQSGVLGSAETVYDGSTMPPATRPPKMHVLAMGAGDYSDSRISKLDYAANSARRFTNMLRLRCGDTYQVSAESLLDRNATSPLWRNCADSLVQRISSTVAPDDLIVIYLCGHGWRDRRNANWYFIPADADYGRLMDDQYSDCVSIADLTSLTKLPCRKLAVIDSCHSGAIQADLRSDDLKSLLRFLQSGLVLTITASEGSEEAAEVEEKELGRFTSRWLDAMSGSADADGDQTITLKEVVAYVEREVASDAQKDGLSQHPTASPRELIETLHLPLVSRTPTVSQIPSVYRED